MIESIEKSNLVNSYIKAKNNYDNCIVNWIESKRTHFSPNNANITAKSNDCHKTNRLFPTKSCLQ